MAESAVSLVIDKLFPLLTREVELWKDLHKEVANIKDELEIICAFLKDADSKAEKQGIGEGVKVWVKQAREEAYHIEDVIDEYMLHVARRRSRHGFRNFLGRVASLVQKLRSRRELASKIGDIRTSLGEIRDRSQRFQFVSLEQAASSGNPRNAILHDPRLGSLFVKEAQLVAIESPRDDLISNLMSGIPRRTMIAVVGMGGVGKTTLAKKVYDHPKVKEHFKCHVWITVSRSYDKRELLRTILKRCHEAKNEPFLERTVAMDEPWFINAIREYLQLERYLIIFDDVWEVEFWEDVEHALLDNDNGSRILTTTRNGGVANYWRRFLPVHVHQMEPLPQKEAWELFCNKAFGFEVQGRCPEDLHGPSLDILRRCGGLPLAIVAVGGLLATKERTILEWRKFLSNLESAKVDDPHIENVLNILSLSYGDLPYHLKSCFLYLGMFPEDFSIKRRRLIQLWVAEGFVQQKQDMTLEEVAEEYFTELIHRSLIQVHQVSFKGIPKTCHVHDLVRDVILSNSTELSFCHISGNCSAFQGIARRLSINNKGSDNAKSTTKSQTRSIMVFNIIEPGKPLIRATFVRFKLLTVLDFEKCRIDRIPKELGSLLHLRYLNLRDTLVSELPKSIGKLQNLETLDLRRSFVEELPVKIGKFPKLRHLLGDHIQIRALKINGSIEHLKSLQTLFMVRVDDDVRLINELQMSKHLRKLGIRNLKREHGSHLCSALEKMSHLKSLIVCSVNPKDEILEVQSLSCPPIQLQSLRLWGQLHRLPEWISKLQNLAKLRLSYTKLMEDSIKVLDALPKLRYLGLIRFGYEGEKMHFEEGGFQKLKYLYLAGLKNLNKIIIDKGALPVLQWLQIGPCPQMRETPSGIQHLKHLKELSFAGMSYEFTQRLSCDRGQDYWMVKHVPILQHDGIFDPHDQSSYGAWVKRNFG